MQTQQQQHIDEIPVDLLIEILLRLPTKSIARCRCVSKFWAAILVRTDFTDSFMTRSQARPQILFSFLRKSDFFFFLTPQVQNKPSLVANNHINLPIDGSSQISGPVRGFVCLTNYRIGTKETVSTIYNIRTGQSIRLPNVKTLGIIAKSYLGFDPIGKQFKVLLIITTPGVSDEHQVLTLGTPNLSWRNVKCCFISYCYPRYCNDGICINGSLYYIARLNKNRFDGAIVCFDVKSEKLRIVNKDEDMLLWSDSTLVNYKGKLGAFWGGWVGGIVTGETTSFELWVLVDAEKHEWSKHLYVFPPLWKNVVAESELFFVGLTGKDEIVLSNPYLTDPFYVYYYNIEGNTVTRVEIQGMSAFKSRRVHASLDHVEGVKLMQNL